jgi:hypothetical protein
MNNDSAVWFSKAVPYCSIEEQNLIQPLLTIPLVTNWCGLIQSKMEAKIIEEILKTQNYLYTKDGKKILEGDFFYSSNDFIGKHIEIIFNLDELFNKLQYGCKPIKNTIKKAIYDKVSELKQPHGLLIDYVVVNKEIINNCVFFKVQITECEADC